MVTYVPTLSVYEAMSREDGSSPLPAFITRKTAEVRDASREACRLARAKGVAVAAGTDAGSPNHPHGCLADELRLMVEAGTVPVDALRSATAVAARALGIERDVGTLEAGKRADLVAVAGDPTADIAAVADVRLVVRDGIAVDRQP